VEKSEAKERLIDHMTSLVVAGRRMSDTDSYAAVLIGPLDDSEVRWCFDQVKARLDFLRRVADLFNEKHPGD